MVTTRTIKQSGQVFWLTGLSGAGKSTLADAMAAALNQQGVLTCTLDGDKLRSGLNRDLGFSEADRTENIRRVAEVTRLIADTGVIVLTAVISPFTADREMAKTLIGPERFVEVYVSTPLAVCERRDVKGLYRKARAGELPNLTGIDSPYEAPANPDITINTDEQSVELACQLMLGKITG